MTERQQDRRVAGMLALREDEMSAALFVFDVESIGLHGEGFAVGWVVTMNGAEFDRGIEACDPAQAWGMPKDRAWVREHVPPLRRTQQLPGDVRTAFWKAWLRAHENWNALMCADVPWPVESRFLHDCLRDNPSRSGPYPLIDIASVLYAAGLDPLKQYERRDDEIGEHNPLSDARHSARLLWETLQVREETVVGCADHPAAQEPRR